jgi:phosphopantothenoylcysteine decarboxylase/phosphopantothenate--cysteine ligase
MLDSRSDTRPLVLLGVAGSIAAFKACDVARGLMDHDLRVQVILTAAGARFVTPLTFHALTGNPALVDMFDPPEPRRIPHIELAQSAALYLIAPCTANVMAKIAHGLADDLVSVAAIATRAPILLAPAMNPVMYRSPIVQENAAALAGRGVHVIGPVEGKLAAHWEGGGRGRMSDPADIVLKALDLLGKR